MRYNIFWKESLVGYFEVDLTSKKLTKIYSEVEDAVCNPFAFKQSFKEVESVLENRRYSKDRRVKIDELRCTFYDDDISTCISPNLLSEGESLITFHRYFSSLYNDKELQKFYHSIFDAGTFQERYQKLVSALHQHFNGLEKEDLLYQTFIADVICINSDRHLNNIAFIRSEDGKFRTCPIFDMGCSFMVGELVNLMHMQGYGVSNKIKKIQNGFALKPFFMNFRTIEKSEHVKKYLLTRENEDFFVLTIYDISYIIMLIRREVWKILLLNFLKKKMVYTK